MNLLDHYVRHFQPVCVRRLAVTYLDNVEIPVSAGTGVQLEDYFRLRAEFPDQPFGSVGYFPLQLLFPRTLTSDQLTLQFHTAPAIPAQKVIRFQMHWQCLCEDVKTLDKSEISRRLELARQ